MRSLRLLPLTLLAALGCSGTTAGSSSSASSTASSTASAASTSSGSGTTGAGSTSSASSSGTTTGGATHGSSSGSGAGTSGGASSTGGAASTGSSGSTGSGPPTAAELLALVQACNEATQGRYQTDDESSAPANIPVCNLNGAVFWQADMDVDCDGLTTSQCNLNTDPAYQAETSLTDSQGNYLDAANLPYVVVPLPSSSRWSYTAAGLQLGAVVAVVYNGQVQYGVFGDEGPSNIIGEASYAMAQSLGIDPDPSTGGTDTGVTYFVFTGNSAVLSHPESHSDAVQLGQTLARQLVQDN